MLIKNGYLAGLGARDIRVKDGVITAIESTLDGPESIDASGLVVIPGFVDTHRHVVQAPLRGIGADMTLAHYLTELVSRINFTPDEARQAVLLGAVEALDAGVTTVLDWGSPPDVAVEALQEAGIRAVLGEQEVHAKRTGLVTNAMAPLGPDYLSIENITRDIKLARELGLLTTIHIGGHQSGGIRLLHEAGLLGPDLHFIHGNKSTDDEIKMIADSGSGLTVSTIIESLMGHGDSAYGRFKAAGGRPALGVDVVINNRPDLFSEMQATLWQERVNAPFPAKDLLKAATADGARAIGRDDIGELKVGNRADIVLLDGLEHLVGVHDDIEGAIVTGLGPENVRTVLVDGKVVKRDGVLTHHDLRALREATRGLAGRVLAGQ